MNDQRWLNNKSVEYTIPRGSMFWTPAPNASNYNLYKQQPTFKPTVYIRMKDSRQGSRIKQDPYRNPNYDPTKIKNEISLPEIKMNSRKQNEEPKLLKV